MYILIIYCYMKGSCLQTSLKELMESNENTFGEHNKLLFEFIIPRSLSGQHTRLFCGTVAVVLVLISLAVVCICRQNHRLPLQAIDNGDRSEMVHLRYGTP